MKSLAVQMPKDLLHWLRDEAARETMKRKERVSMNTVVLEILTRAMDNQPAESEGR